MLMLVPVGCSGIPPLDEQPKAEATTEKCADYVYEYLRANPLLFARDGDEIVFAPAEDSAVAQQYPQFEDKGPVHNGQRITIMTAKSTYRVGEEVRIIHVLEAPEPGYRLYVMGPKTIVNEFVDGKLASPESSGWFCYDGRVINSPGIDFNYEVSTYTFDTPGEHTIQWKGGCDQNQGDLKLESNVLRIMVTR